jgi:hypothetical protein
MSVRQVHTLTSDSERRMSPHKYTLWGMSDATGDGASVDGRGGCYPNLTVFSCREHALSQGGRTIGKLYFLAQSSCGASAVREC